MYVVTHKISAAKGGLASNVLIVTAVAPVQVSLWFLMLLNTQNFSSKSIMLIVHYPY